ncbi:MAG: alpha/beta fold hydrolase [Verrucomicrobiota bacterium]
MSLPDPLRALYPFTSHWLQTAEGRIHYLDEGAGEAIVFVHGNPTWSFFYRNIVSALRSQYRCIALDHLGMGLSDKPQDAEYRLAMRIEHLSSLIDHLGLERYHLVVHDWGGAIGMGAALKHPERVDRIQIFNTAAFRSKRMPWQIGLCRTPVLGEYFMRGLNGFSGSATTMAVTNKLPSAVKDGYLYPYGNWKDRVAIARFVQDIPMQPDHPSYNTLLQIENGLEQLCSKPMQIIWGMRDFCFDQSFLEAWIARFPEAIVHRLEGAGHYLLEDAAEECRERFSRFLEA